MSLGNCVDCGSVVKKRGAIRCLRCNNRRRRSHPESNPSYKGGRHISNRGYVFLSSPGHPRAWSKGNYVAEHILVMEKKIGRILDPKNDVVHHINGIKGDNRPENLFLTTNVEHPKLHAIKTRCKICGGKYRSKGYCEKHYSRWKKLGFPKSGCPEDKK